MVANQLQQRRFIDLAVYFFGFAVIGVIIYQSSYRNITTFLRRSTAYSHIRPPLESFISGSDDADNATITAPVDWLLDFVIAGHPKCATTSVMHALYGHPEIQMHDEEVHLLKKGATVELVQQLYNLPAGSHYKRGYKDPNDIRLYQSLWLLQKYFSRTKLIVGVRHPVRWFESWWNFKTAQGDLDRSAESYEGRLPPMVEYHKNLAQLGKTNPLTSDHERELLGNDFPRALGIHEVPFFQELGITLVDVDTRRPPSSTVVIQRMDHPVFLYAEEQLSDPVTLPEFLSSLQAYLGLEQPLHDIPRNNTATDHPNPNHMDICDDQFTNLRQELVELGSSMAKWLLLYFLPLPDVSVSSPQRFKELLLRWKQDPCQQL